MAGSVLPVVVAHGEGRAEFTGAGDQEKIERDHLITLRYVDHHHQVTERYPHNPNGSPARYYGFNHPGWACHDRYAAS